jgi:phage virion morphogenesis protein
VIELRDNSPELAAALGRVAAAAENAGPLMRVIAGIMHDEVEENFAQQGRPRWLGLKAPVAKRRQGGMILQDSGQLAASIEQGSDAKSAWVGTNKIYAAIHQLGGKTRAHDIKPRYKKALKFGGRYAKVVHHPGSTIPARPFLVITPSGERRILSAVNDYLRKAGG